MVSENGDPSDESVLYTGTFLSFAEDAKISLTSKYEKLMESSAAEIILLQESLAAEKKMVGEKENEISALKASLQQMAASNTELSVAIDELQKEIDSASAAAASAAAAQAQAEEALSVFKAEAAGEIDLSGIKPLANIGNIQAQLQALQNNTL